MFLISNSETKIMIDTRPPPVTEVTRTKSSIETQDPAQPDMGSALVHPTRPYMESDCGELKALVLISEFKDNQISRLTTEKGNFLQ